MSVSRPYTPTSLQDQKGYFELVIKVYFAGVHPKFPDGGKMSQHLEQLNINDTVNVKGPRGKMTYRGGGVLSVTDALGKNERTVRVSEIGMIAGGTGITPMYQIIQAIFLDENDTTKINLLFANQTEEDILIREDLEQFSRKYPNRFNLWYTLDRPGDTWTFSKGFINEEMIRERLPTPGDDTLILICGPPPMVEYACRPNLEKVGFDLNTQVFTF
ncbi:NADH-cytochrome b5 reductase 1 [Oopsacas minuta]|uniref:NADH-cytochrome b5 reductase n=1 Tax=Oopsacas minuta TaxID=111878 RepID=A0AAV7KMZ5_9METZ|nr:NADH-cytochrome b5 reductase 1 [Oopsacas minuta]